MAENDSAGAREHIQQALAMVDKFEILVAAWQTYATARQYSNGTVSQPGLLDLGCRGPRKHSSPGAQRVQFRLEVFNLLNHPNGDVANSNPRSGSFGQMTNNE